MVRVLRFFKTLLFVLMITELAHLYTTNIADVKILSQKSQHKAGFFHIGEQVVREGCKYNYDQSIITLLYQSYFYTATTPIFSNLSLST